MNFIVPKERSKMPMLTYMSMKGIDKTQATVLFIISIVCTVALIVIIINSRKW